MASLVFFIPLPASTHADFSAFEKMLHVAEGYGPTAAPGTTVFESVLVVGLCLLLVPPLYMLLRRAP